MYTLAIVGVYACLTSGGRVTGDRHASISRCQRSIKQAARDLTLSLSKAPHPLPATACSAPWEELHQKGAAASQQLLAHF